MTPDAGPPAHEATELHPKVAAMAASTPFTVLLMYALRSNGIDVPDEVSSAIAVLIAGVFAYFAPWIPKAAS
jgi:hypothetical protein